MAPGNPNFKTDKHPGKNTQFSSENQPLNNGRPEGSKSRSTIAKKWLDTVTEWENPLTGKLEFLSIEDQITLAQIKEARDGEHNKAINYKVLMDSRHGAPKQEIDMIGEIKLTDHRLTIEVIIAKDDDEV